MPDFWVVGGGVAGLVVARRLALGGAAVALSEASGRLGGTVTRHTVGGIDLDAGAESFAVRGGTVAALLAELGLADDIVAPSPSPAWLQPAVGAPAPLPATSLLGIPADPLAADVVAVLGAAAAQNAAARDAAPLGTIPPTLGPLVRERMGDAVLDRLVVPVVRGVHSVHPDELPLERAHPRLAAAVAEHGSLALAVAGLRAAMPAGAAVGGIRGGMHRLSAELGADLVRLGVDVRLGERIDDLRSLGGTPIVATSGRAGQSVMLVTLVVDHDDLDAAPRGTGVLVAPDAPGIRARALTHATAKWDWLRELAQGRHVVRLSYDEAPADAVATALRDASALLGVELAAGDLLDAAVVTWTRPAPARPRRDDVAVGESVAGTGLASVVAHADRIARDLLVGNLRTP